MESYITKKKGKSGVKKEQRLMGGSGGQVKGGGLGGTVVVLYLYKAQ